MASSIEEKDGGFLSPVTDFLSGAFGSDDQQESRPQEQAQQEGTGFVDSVVDTVQDAGRAIGNWTEGSTLGVVGSNVVESVKDIAGSAENAVEKLFKGDFKGILDPVSKGSLADTQYVDMTKNGRDAYAKKFAQENGYRETGAMLSGLAKTGWDVAMRNTIGGKLKNGVDTDAFAKGVSDLEREMADIQKKSNDVTSSDPTLSDVVRFNQETMDEYALSGKSNFDSQEFSDFQKAKFDALDVATQQAILVQQSRMQEISAKFSAEYQEAKAKRDKYVSDNVIAEGSLDAVGVYEKTKQDAMNNFSNSETVKLNMQMREEAEDRLSKDLMERDPKRYATISKELPALRDAVLEDMVRNEEFIARMAGNDRIPEELRMKALKKYEDGSDVEYDFNLKFLDQYSRIKNLPEYKAMSDLEKHEEARKLAYDSLTPSQKGAWREREGIVTALNAASAKYAAKDGNFFENAYQLIKLSGAAIGGYIDQAYDDSDDAIPHYVRQETRDIAFANASGLNKFVSAITYNSDAIVGLVSATSAANKVVGKAGALVDVAADLAKGSNVAMGIAKVGALQAPLTFLGKGASLASKFTGAATQSIVSSAITDPIMDANQVQANTKSIDQMNVFIGTMFDMSGLGLGKGYRSMNEIVAKYALGDEEAAVKFMSKAYKEKFGIEKDPDQIRNELQSAVKIAYDTYDPGVMKNLFEKPGQMYDFLRTNVDSMLKSGSEHQLNAGGLMIGLNTFSGLSKDEFADITKLEEKALKPVTAKPTTAEAKSSVLAKQEFQKQLSQIQEFAKGNGQYGETAVDTFKRNDPSFIKDSAAVVKKAEEVKLGTAKAKELVPMLEDFKLKYGDKENTAYVTMRLMNDPSGQEFRFKFQDLKTLDGMQNKSFVDVLREGKVKVANYSQGLKAGDYRIVTTNKSAAASAKSAVKNSEKNIIKYVAESSSRTGIPSSEIQFSMENGIRRFIAEGEANFQHLRKITNDPELYEREMKEVAKVVDSMARAHFGQSNFGKTHFINDMNIPGATAGRVDPEKLIEKFGEQDGLVNVNYGKYKGKFDKAGEESNRFYVTLGKDAVKYRPNIAAKLEKKVKHGDGKKVASLQYYCNSASHIVNNALRFGRKADGTLNFRKGLDDADLIETSMEVGDLFKNKEVNRDKISEIVKATIENPTEQLIDFITYTFKGADKGHGAVIAMQTMHLARMYAEHEPLIKALFTKYGTEKKFSYVEAFANMVLAPKLYESVASNIVRKGGAQSVEQRFKDTAEKKWKSYVNKVKGQKMKWEDEAKRFTQYASEEKDKALRDAYRQLAADATKKAKTLESSIGSDRMRETFIKNDANVMMTEAMVKNIRNSAKGFAFSKMAGFSDGMVASVESALDGAKKLRKLVKQLPKETSDKLKENFVTYKSLYGDKKSGELLDAMMKDSAQYKGEAKEAHDIIKRIINSGIGEINLEDKEFVLKTIADASSGTYDSEFVKKHNPFVMFMQGMVAGTGTRDEAFEKGFKAKFGIPEDQNLFQAYHEGGSKQFKDFVDSLEATKDGAKDYPAIMKAAFGDMGETVSGIEIRVRDANTGDLSNKSQELFEEAMYDKRFIDSLKRVKRSELTEGNIEYGGTEVWEYDKYNREFQKKTQYVEKVLQCEILKEKLGMRIGFMRELAAKDFGRLSADVKVNFIDDEDARLTYQAKNGKRYPKKGKSLDDAYENIKKYARAGYGHDEKSGTVNGVKVVPGEKGVTLSQIANTFYNDTYDYHPDVNVRMRAIASPTIAYEFFQDLFNRVPFSEVKGKYGNKTVRVGDAFVDLEANWNVLCTEARRKFGFNGTEMKMMGGFGDKDGTYMFWKPSEATLKNLPDGYEPSMAVYDNIYRYEYQLANGYHNGGIASFEEGIAKMNSSFKAQFEKRKKELLASSGEERKRIETEILQSIEKDMEADNGVETVQNTKKRESANMSNYSTFEGYDEPVEFYVLKSDSPSPLARLASDADGVDKKKDPEGYLGKMRDVILGFSNVSSADSNRAYLKRSLDREASFFGVSISDGKVEGTPEGIESLFSFLKTSYLNDLEDGTSYVSSKLARIRAEIQGLKHADKKMEFKDHFFGGDEGGRILGKTLFNSATVKLDGNVLENAVIVGESSLKLGKKNKGRYEKFSEPKFIEINGEMREVVGKVSGARTSFFKNAATESKFKEDDIAASDSIMAKLKRPFAEAIMNIQKTRIDKAFESHKADMSDPSIKSSSFSKTDQEIMNVVSKTGLGLGHQSIVSMKLAALISAFKEIVSKPRDGGQSMYVFKSSYDISPEEVIVTEKSPLYQTAKAQRDMRIAEINADGSISDEQKKAKVEAISKDLLVVGYRYPVPSRHALGLHRLVLPNDPKLLERNPKANEIYGNMGDHRVILNPEATYMKYQGDNDGDHLFFLPVYGNESTGDIGNVLANSIIADSLESAGLSLKISPNDKSWEWFAQNKDSFFNRFVTAEQVEKSGESEFISLRQSRNIALTAKASIGIVAAYGRTMTTLKQTFDSYEKLSGKEKEEYGKKMLSVGERHSAETATVAELYGKYGEAFKKLDGPDGAQFDANFASLLQLTLDFGNSGKTTFDMDWYVDSLKHVFGNDEQGVAKAMQFFHDVVTKLSTSYNKFEIDRANISGVIRAMDKKAEGKLKEGSYDDEILYGLLGATGNKRELMEYMIDAHGRYIKALNNNIVLEYAVKHWNSETKDKFVKELKRVIGSASADKYKNQEKISDLEFKLKSAKGSKKEEIEKEIERISNFKLNQSDVDMFGSLTKEVKEPLRKHVENVLGKFVKEGNPVASKTKEYLDRYLNVKNENPKIRGEEFDKMAADLISSNESEDVRNALAMIASTYDVREIYQVLMNNERMTYLQHANEGLFRRLAEINMSDAAPFQSSKDLSVIESKIEMIEAAVGDLPVDEADIAKNTIAGLKRDADKIRNAEYAARKNAKKIDENVTKEMPLLDATELRDMPLFEYESALKNPQAFANSIETMKGVSKMQDRAVSMTTKSLFEKYLPEFTNLQEYVRNFFTNDVMKKAYKFHVDEISPRVLGRSDSIYRQIRNEIKHGGTTDAIRYVQQSMIKEVGGQVVARSDEEMMDFLKRHPEKYGISDLVERKEFFERAMAYRDNVVRPILDMVNEIGRQKNIDIYRIYRNTKRGEDNTSLLYDALEAYKSDNMFAAMILGLSDELKIKRKIEESAAASNSKVWDMTKTMMARMIVRRDPHVLDKLIDTMQGLHYMMNYGIVGFAFGGALIAGLAQILPNYVELTAYRRMNRKSYEEAMVMMKRYGILNSEDTLHFSTGNGLNVQENFITQAVSAVTKNVIESVALAVGLSEKKARRAGEIIDSMTNNMLGFNDWPLEEMRKVYAIATEMDSMGIKTAADFERLIANSGARGIEAFNSRVSKTFSESGGGAVSSWNVSRGTVFSEAHLAFDNLAVRFVLRSIGYLNGWAYHKAATLVEKNSAMLSIPHMLMEGRGKEAAATMRDVMKYDAMLARQAVSVMGLYLKVQRYENDENDKMSFLDFQKAFNNGLVWTSILFDRYLESWAAADQFNGTLGDKVGFTGNAFVKHVFRHMNQASFFMDAWRKYNKDVALNGSGDIADAVAFAFENNYNSFLRFGGLQESNRLYSQAESDPTLGILFIGGETPSDKVLGNLDSGKSFAKWKASSMSDKFLSVFPFMSGFDDSLGFNLSTEVAKELEAIALKDPKLYALVYGGRLGTAKNEYDLKNILGSSGITEEDAKDIEGLWKKISYYKYETLNSKGERVSSSLSKINESKDSALLEDRINKELARNGVSMEALISGNPNIKPGLLKTMQVLNMDSNLKTPLVLAVIMDQEYDAKAKALRDEKGMLTGERSAYGTPYKELSPEQQLALKRDIMVKYQEYMNLDNGLVMDVVSRHFRKYNNDVLEKLDREYGTDDAAFADPKKQDYMIGYQAEKLLTTQYLVSNIMKTEGDTSSVTKLQSRYSVAMKGLDVSNETGVAVAIKFMKDIETNNAMDAKTKLAHQAAVIYGLNKTQYGLLKDEERFSKLSSEAQTKIANWMYKVSSETLAFDSNSYLNGLNKASEGSGHSYAPKFNSKKFSGQRPNFSKQFEPVRQMMPTVNHMVSENPNAYFQEEMKRSRPIGYGAQPQIQKEYAKIWFEQIYFGQKSKGVIPTYVMGKGVDSPQKSYIKVGTSKKKFKTEVKPGKKMSFQSKFGMLNPGKFGTQSFIMDPGAQQEGQS